MELFTNLKSWLDDINARQKELDIQDAAIRRGPTRGKTDNVGNLSTTVPEWLAGLRGKENNQKVDDQISINNILTEIGKTQRENPDVDLNLGLTQNEGESNLEFARRKQKGIDDRIVLTGLNTKAKDAGITAPDFTTMKVAEAREKLAVLERAKALNEAGISVNPYEADGKTVRTELGALNKEGRLGQVDLDNEATKGSITYLDNRRDRAEDIARDTAI